MNADAANIARCQDRPGTYEAWYVTVSDPGRRQGFWIRYTTLNPAAGVPVEGHSALWAFAFDRDDPSANWAAKATFPLRALQVESRPFAVRLQGAALSRDGCSGGLHSERGSARWDLHWTSREPPFPFLRPRWQALSSVANIGAQPALTVSGTIEINGRTHNLEEVPGGQQHTWGSSHALSWNWGFASGPDFWVDGATSRVRSRLGRVLVGTAVGARGGGSSVPFQQSCPGPAQSRTNLTGRVDRAGATGRTDPEREREAKAASSLTSLALFLAPGYAYAFLANFLVDGAIALITLWFYRQARPELSYPT